MGGPPLFGCFELPKRANQTWGRRRTNGNGLGGGGFCTPRFEEAAFRVPVYPAFLKAAAFVSSGSKGLED